MPMSLICPTAAYTCFSATVSTRFFCWKRVRPTPTAPDVTRTTSTPFFFKRDICSARCSTTSASIEPSSFDNTFVPTFATTLLYIYPHDTECKPDTPVPKLSAQFRSVRDAPEVPRCGRGMRPPWNGETFHL